MRTFVAALLVSFLVSIPATSQTVSTAVAPKNATAASLLAGAVRALAGGTPISSVTLTGTATRTAGSDVETGSVTLEALGGTAGRIDLALSDGSRSEIINQAQGKPASQWSGTDGTAHAAALHNCWTPADWFFPALALAEALNDPSVALTYVGQETLNGEAVQHVRFWRILPAQTSDSTVESLSAADVYFDASKGLPVELDFNIHPDKNAAVNLPVEIRYGDYQQLNGILLPAHIEKLINHSLVLDINVTGAAVNSNLSTADFAVTAVSQ